MKVDLTEDDKAFRVEAEMPGAKKEDIRVELDRDRVTVRVEVKAACPEGKYERIVCAERSYGTLSRSFTLPREVDDQRVTMEYQDGILRLTLPKAYVRLRTDGELPGEYPVRLKTIPKTKEACP
jgi:HSP20 family protein